MTSLILASRSLYRLQLLREAGYQAEAWPADIDEPDPRNLGDLRSGLIHLAQRKAATVAARGACGLVLAADTVGHVAGEVFGKPTSRADAERMLRAISGVDHEVLTGWCLLRTRDGLRLSGVEATQIHMRPWTAAELQCYLDSGEWQGKCGGYGLQLPLDPFVTRLQGSAANVIGLPLERLAQVFQEFPGLKREPE
ncbi:MAG: Maf-like protein [Planctomycetaceae bacterium]|nr:MAG: Maf-like protein [Planctomycetaceae bacterium]